MGRIVFAVGDRVEVSFQRGADGQVITVTLDKASPEGLTTVEANYPDVHFIRRGT